MSHWNVTRCPANRRAAALRLLLAARDPAQQDALAFAVQSVGAIDGEDAAWDGLLSAGDAAPQAALWIQFTPGNTAVVWPPPADHPAADALFRAAAELVDVRRLGVAQLIVGEHDGFLPEPMGDRGFGRLAELVYMFADPLPPPAQSRQSSQSLQFRPFADREPTRLAQMIEQTYLESRDCPSLDGVRSITEVLAGYRAHGEHDPEHWYLVADGTQDIGVLLLANHPSAGSWELVYMGVIPHARARRHGEAIARFALETVGHCGAQRLVLAVDAANEPALAMYRRSGFREWDRRTVYARLTAPNAHVQRLDARAH